MRRLYWYDAVILRLVLDDFSRLLILQNFIGPTIRIGREIRCLPYAGFFVPSFGFEVFSFNLVLLCFKGYLR